MVNTIARPRFMTITVRDGELYGALIDILRNSAPLMLVALGMTIVIATRGIDLSVGALMAVSGAVALTIIDGSSDPGSTGHACSSRSPSAWSSRSLLGAWNGFLVAVLGIQPIIATLVLMLAGRGIALLITGGFITTVNSAPLEFVSQRLPGRAPVRLLHLDGGRRGRRADRAAHGARRADRGGRHQPRGEPAGRRTLARHHPRAPTSVSGLLAGIAGIIYSSNIMAADANAAGDLIELYAILAVVLGGTSLMGGKFTIAGTVIGVLTIQTLKSTILFLGVPSAQSPLFFAVVVIVVVLIQSPRVHRMARGLTGGTRSAHPTRRRRGGRRHERRGRHAVAERRPRTPRPDLPDRHASLMPDVRRAGHPHRAARRRRRSTSATSSPRGTCRRCCSTTPTC